MTLLSPDVPILKVENFSKNFIVHEQEKIIQSSHAVNLEVYAGQLTALFGTTGAGKSSILRAVYRTYLSSSGRILYRTETGQLVDLTQLDEHCVLELRRTEISFVTQFMHAIPRQSTQDIVAMPLLKKGMDKHQALMAAHKTLAAMNLPENLWNVSPATFSGGEKQRVNLARGLVSRPRLLLLDEPTASLDKKTTELVINSIEEIKREGTAILAVFHQPELIARMSDNIVEIRASDMNAQPLVEMSI